MEGNYSLSDIRSVVGDNDGLGFGGGGLLILIVLFLLFGGGAWNRQGEFDRYATAASQNEILSGQKFDALSRQVDHVGDGICSSTYALNNAITGEGRNIQMQLANCCCENQRNVDSVRYDMANFAAATNANTTAQIQKVLDAIAQDKIASLQNQVNQLQLQAAMCGVVRYPQATTYTSGVNPFCGGATCC